jgi:hypothetical protein
MMDYLIGSPVDVQSERFTQIPSYVRFPVDQELVERQERFYSGTPEKQERANS